jgi:hypothetical protein
VGRSERIGFFVGDREGKNLAGLDSVLRASWIFADSLCVDGTAPAGN